MPLNFSTNQTHQLLFDAIMGVSPTLTSPQDSDVYYSLLAELQERPVGCVVSNIFCATGKDGGKDPTCTKDNGGGVAPSNSTVIAKLTPREYKNKLYVAEERVKQTQAKVSQIIERLKKLRKLDPQHPEISGLNKRMESLIDDRVKSEGDVEVLKRALSSNAFCPTGKGGGKDNSCSSKEGTSNGFNSVTSIESLRQVNDGVGSVYDVDDFYDSVIVPWHNSGSTKPLVQYSSEHPEEFEKLRTASLFSLWKGISGSKLPFGDFLKSADVQLYRGVYPGSKENGRSWSLSKKVAESFAKYGPKLGMRLGEGNPGGKVISRLASTSDVLFYSDEQGEQEVIVRMRGKSDSIPTANVKTSGKFSSTQVNLPLPLAGECIKMANRIPEEDLAEDGREYQPHITIKYGLHADELPEELLELLQYEVPPDATLGSTSIFKVKDKETGEPKYDVVKINVDSEDLVHLNKLFSSTFECTDTHPVYQPHITLAYVKPGRGKNYVGMNDLKGVEVEFPSMVFSNKKQVHTKLEFLKPVINAWCPTGKGGGKDNSCSSRSSVPKFDPNGNYPLYHVTSEVHLSDILKNGLGSPDLSTYNPVSDEVELLKDGAVSWTRDAAYAIVTGQEGGVRLVVENKQSLQKEGFPSVEHVALLAVDSTGDVLVPGTNEFEEVTRGIIPSKLIDRIEIPPSLYKKMEANLSNYKKWFEQAAEEQASADPNSRKYKMLGRRSFSYKKYYEDLKKILDDPRLKVGGFAVRDWESGDINIANIFCATGPGGGVDPTCTKDSPDYGSGSGGSARSSGDIGKDMVEAKSVADSSVDPAKHKAAAKLMAAVARDFAKSGDKYAAQKYSKMANEYLQKAAELKKNPNGPPQQPPKVILPPVPEVKIPTTPATKLAQKLMPTTPSTKQPGKEKYGPGQELRATALSSYEDAHAGIKKIGSSLKKDEFKFQQVEPLTLTDVRYKMSLLNGIGWEHQMLSEHHKVASALTNDGGKVRYHRMMSKVHENKAEEGLKQYNDLRQLELRMRKEEPTGNSEFVIDNSERKFLLNSLREYRVSLEEGSSVSNAFCPTGKGGGKDNTCSSRGGKGLAVKERRSTHLSSGVEELELHDGTLLKVFRNPSKTQVKDWASKYDGDIRWLGLPEGSGYPDGTLYIWDAKEAEHNSVENALWIKSNVPDIFAIASSSKTLSDDIEAAWEWRKSLTWNAFCPTGKGGGKDNSCSPKSRWSGVNELTFKNEASINFSLPLYHNPSFQQALGWMNKYGELRGLFDPRTGDIYVWEAGKATHNRVADELGLDWYAGKGYDVDHFQVKSEGVLRIKWDRYKKLREELTINVFCPTGKGGGKDPTCTKEGSYSSYTDLQNSGIPKSLVALVKKSGIKISTKSREDIASRGGSAYLKYQGTMVLGKNLQHPFAHFHEFGHALDHAMALKKPVSERTFDEKEKYWSDDALVRSLASDKKAAKPKKGAPSWENKIKSWEYAFGSTQEAFAHIFSAIQGDDTTVNGFSIKDVMPKTYTLVEKHLNKLTANAFCPTGKGGGQDNSCPPNKGHSEGTSIPFSFSSVDQVHEVLSQGYQQWYDNLSKEEQAALMAYKGIGYAQINGWLRDPKNSNPKWMVAGLPVKFKLRDEIVKHIDSALGKAPSLGSDVLVYRGFHASVDVPVGSVIEDKGYASTSLLKSKANEFRVGNPKSAPGKFTGPLLEITIPKGSKVGYMEPVKSVNKGEEELVIPRNSKLHVTYSSPDLIKAEYRNE